jgi:outer membrane immunogenic protein
MHQILKKGLNMRKLGIIVPLLAGFAAVPAYAQDLGVTARAEVRLGYDEARAGIRAGNENFNGDFGVKGVGYGVEAGVDARITESILVGAYAGADFSKADDCVDRPFEVFASTRRDIVCLDAGTNLTVGLRAGLPMADGGLIYAKGGYSRGKFQGSYSSAPATPANAPIVERFSDSDTVGGYHVGGGFELSFGGGFYGKAEYVHTRYKDAFKEAIAATGTGSTSINELDPDRHQLMAGFGIRFGGGR